MQVSSHDGSALDAGLLASKLRVKGEQLVGLMESLTEDKWNMTVYHSTPSWTVREVFAHLVATEKDYLRLFENVRRGGLGAREGFDIDGHNARRLRETGAIRLADLAAEFRIARARMVDFVSGLTELDLERSGRHPYLGVVTLREMVKMVYIHTEIHQRDLRHRLMNG